MEILKWIEHWYSSHCDGDWEHAYGVKIGTLDNPGWSIEIDLADTQLAHLILEAHFVEESDNDWYRYHVKDSVFYAYGDANKLQFLMELFRRVVEDNS